MKNRILWQVGGLNERLHGPWADAPVFLQAPIQSVRLILFGEERGPAHPIQLQRIRQPQP